MARAARSADPGRAAFPPWESLGAAHLAALFIVALALTPFTYYLDDIKVSLFNVFGGAMALAAVGAMTRGWLPLPPRIALGGLAGYAAALALSTLASEFSWVGRLNLVFFWSSVGFFLGGLACGATPRAADRFLKGVTALLLLTIFLGFLQYDFFGTGGTGMSLLYRVLYGISPARDTPVAGHPLRALLYTFSSEASQSLMSTILNRDFFAGFCLLYYPFALALALSPVARPWRLAGALAVFGAFVSIFLCKSKGEYLFAAVSILFFAAILFASVKGLGVRKRVLAAWGGGAFLFLATLLLLNAPNLMDRLKSVSFSVSSRQMMFKGAWQIFLDHPILGGGPGTYRIYFPQYRPDNYFEHEINNVTEFSHNYLLDILSETGLFGIVSYGVFALALAFGAFRLLFRRGGDPRLQLLVLASLTGLLGLFGNNMSSPSARWAIGATGLWSALGFLAGLIRQGEGWVPPAESAGWSSGASSARRLVAAPSPLRLWLTRGALLLAVVGLFACGFHAQRYWRASVAYQAGLGPFDHYINRASALLRDRQGMTDQEWARQIQYSTSGLESSGAAFRRAIALYPGHLSAYYKLGSVENMLSLIAEGAAPVKERDAKAAKHLLAARDTYEVLGRLCPDYSEIHYNIGVIYFRLADMARRRGRGFDPKTEGDAAKLKAEVASYEELSRKAYEKMEKMSRKAEVIRNLGESHMDAGDFALAQAAFRRGAKLYPDRRDLAWRYYQTSSRLNDAPGMIDALKAMWLINPGESAFIYGKSETFGQEIEGALDLALAGKLEASFDEILAEALRRNPVDPELHARAARMSWAKNDAAAARKFAANHFKLGGRDPEILGKAAESAEASGDAEFAKELYSALAQLKSDGSYEKKARAWLAAHPPA